MNAIWIYLFVVILLQNGLAQTTMAVPFRTLEDCNAAGEAEAARIRADVAILKGGWRCMIVDFDLVDPNGRAAT